MAPNTYFVDIDGVLLKHQGSLSKIITGGTFKNDLLLEGVLEKINEWEAKGSRIILTTGRKESMRKITESQLDFHGIFYDQLIMGVGGGPRYLINDMKPDGTKTAFAVNLERNVGLKYLNCKEG